MNEQTFVQAQIYQGLITDLEQQQRGLEILDDESRSEHPLGKHATIQLESGSWNRSRVVYLHKEVVNVDGFILEYRAKLADKIKDLKNLFSKL